MGQGCAHRVYRHQCLNASLLTPKERGGACLQGHQTPSFHYRPLEGPVWPSMGEEEVRSGYATEALLVPKMGPEFIMSMQMLLRSQEEKVNIVWLKAVKNILKASHLESLVKGRLLQQGAPAADTCALCSGAMSP